MADLTAIASHRVADRPDRFEPRMAKRRPKRYDRLTRPREEIKRRMLKRVSEISVPFGDVTEMACARPPRPGTITRPYTMNTFTTGGTGRINDWPVTRCVSGRTGYAPGMAEMTHILAAVEPGDPQATGDLLPLVYDELRHWRRGSPQRSPARRWLPPPWSTRPTCDSWRRAQPSWEAEGTSSPPPPRRCGGS